MTPRTARHLALAALLVLPLVGLAEAASAYLPPVNCMRLPGDAQAQVSILTDAKEKYGNTAVPLPFDIVQAGYYPRCVAAKSGGSVTWTSHDRTFYVHDPLNGHDANGAPPGGCFHTSRDAADGTPLGRGDTFSLRVAYDGVRALVSADDGATWRDCTSAAVFLTDTAAVIPYRCLDHNRLTAEIVIKKA